jgi:Fungal trichothecene efflux pump (TRI12)
MQTLFFGLAALITPYNISWVMAAQFLAMLPFGWITLNCYTTASLHVPQRDLGVAIGLIGTFRSLGGAVGSVIFPSIFGQVSAKQVALRVADIVGSSTPPAVVANLTEAVKLTLLGIPDQAATVPSISASAFASCVEAARLGYAYGLRITWLASIPFGIIAVLCAIAVRDPSKYFTNHVEIHLEREIGGRKKVVENKEAEPAEL